jgi:hypothetical protein
MKLSIMLLRSKETVTDMRDDTIYSNRDDPDESDDRHKFI